MNEPVQTTDYVGPQPADVIELVKILGHAASCPSRLPEDDWRQGDCYRDFPECSVWRTAEGLLSAENLNTLLAEAWKRGFEACAIRVGNDLLALLPRQIDSTNPYLRDGQGCSA